VVPITAAAATAAAPTRAILLLLIRASFWRTALQTSYSPGLGWHLAALSPPLGGVVAAATHVMQKAARRLHGSQPPAPGRMTHPIPANSHQTLRTSDDCTQTYDATCDRSLVVRNPPVTAWGGETTPARTPSPTRAAGP